MAKLRKLAIAGLAGLLVSSCSPSYFSTRSAKEIQRIEPPEWFRNIPVSQDTLYATGTALSQDFQFSLDIAEMNATANLAESIESFIIKNGNLTTLTTGMHLYDVRTLKTDWQREGSLYRSYVLMGMPMENLRLYKWQKKNK